ncbi:MAG: gliding motility-associated C-terminal domain-containing protein [bacterium]
MVALKSLKPLRTVKSLTSLRSLRLSRSLFLLFPLFTFHFSLSPLQAQEPIAPLTRWLATVDEESQQIVLSWNASADSQAMGYHVCTGNPCLDYDTVFGRFDTTLFCADHAVTEPHTYRLHIFDSLYNVSPLTPLFGNIVLTADVPQCSTDVHVAWTPYKGMPTGVVRYQLYVRIEPSEEGYQPLYTTDSMGPFAYHFDISEEVTRIWLKVRATGFPDSLGHAGLVSQSNVIMVKRLTVDTARYLAISSVEYDSIEICNRLTLKIDTSYHDYPYTLWRSIDGTPWDSIASFLATDCQRSAVSYIDRDINPYDSIHCYQLSVPDACGMNPNYSQTQCVVVPDPPPPSIYIPNTVVCNDPANGAFLPRVRGLQGTLYELHVYNRMGALVFHTSDPGEAWIPGNNVPQGVYAYTLRCRFNDNRIQTYTGTVLVLK